MFSAAVELHGAAAAGLLPFFGAASAASRRAQAPLNLPTTPYRSRPDHPPRCPPSFPRLPRPESARPITSVLTSRRDASLHAVRHGLTRVGRSTGRRASASAACRDVDVDDWRVENAVLGAAGSAIPRRRYGL